MTKKILYWVLRRQIFAQSLCTQFPENYYPTIIFKLGIERKECKTIDWIIPCSYYFSRGQIFAHFVCAKIRNFARIYFRAPFTKIRNSVLIFTQFRANCLLKELFSIAFQKDEVWKFSRGLIFAHLPQTFKNSVLISPNFAQIEVLLENAWKFVRAKISTNKVVPVGCPAPLFQKPPSFFF